MEIKTSRVLEITSEMISLLNEMEKHTQKFSIAVSNYASSMQDATAEEATKIVDEMKIKIINARTNIEKRSATVLDGTTALKNLENKARKWNI